MMRALRSLLLAGGLFGLAPGAASADVTIAVDETAGVLEIHGDAVANSITTLQSGTAIVITGANLVPSLPCDGSTTSVTCPLSAVRMIAVDLEEGEDEFASSRDVTVPQSIDGGLDDDDLSGGGAGDVLAGGSGNDTLNGAGGVDDYFGETGNDTILANDGIAERIACGAGTDIVTNDFTDIIAECENGVDGDNDSFNSRVDCNDANAAIRPGAPEIFGNGVDEDCNGRDDVNRDADADGFAIPVDCDDSSAAIRPGALEVRGNAIDENCDSRAEPWRVVPALVSNRWAVLGSRTRLQTLVVRVAPKDAVVRLSCRGSSCPFKRARTRTVARDLDPVSFSRVFRGVTLRPGTRLTLSINLAQSIGRTFTYTVRRGALPDSRDRLQGARRRQGGPVLTRALALAIALLVLAPATPARGPSRSSARASSIPARWETTRSRPSRTPPACASRASARPRWARRMRPATFHDGQSVVCSKAGVQRVLLELGDGDDVVAISASVTLPVTMNGGGGNDGLFGGSGDDEFFGGAGDDNLVSRDGRAEKLDCGLGNDTAISDDGDTRISCEQVEGDADLDGVRRPADCDDTNPGRRPGVDRHPGQRRRRELRRRRRHRPRPRPRRDRSPAGLQRRRRGDPAGRAEVIGNTVDENCDTRIEPFPPVLGSLTNGWSEIGSGTRNESLVARRFPRGTRISVSCSGGGCPFKTFRRTVRRTNQSLHAPFGDAVLRRNARVDVRITRDNRIGRLLRFRFGKPGQPTVAFLCLPPGGGTRDC